MGERADRLRQGIEQMEEAALLCEAKDLPGLWREIRIASKELAELEKGGGVSALDELDARRVKKKDGGGESGAAGGGGRKNQPRKSSRGRG